MDMKALSKLLAIRATGHDHVVVALSGGVDSALVAAAAHAALGKSAVAVTVHSELTARRDFTRAVEIAEHIGIEHHPLLAQVLNNERIRRNDETRCYHCKNAIFELMSLEYGDACLIVDGTNRDDDPARPGLRAVREHGVFSPLLEAGLGKGKVRELARVNGLPNWNAPSESCLATRIPVGNSLSRETLNRVQVMESFFQERGVETLRARPDNLVVTVEYLPQFVDIINENRDKFAALIKGIGLRSVLFKEWSE